MKRKPSKEALTPTTTHDDGSFIRTALVLDAKTSAQIGSVDLVSPSGERIAQLNITLYPDGALIVDTIDTEKRWGQTRAFLFGAGEPRVFHTTAQRGAIVSADFRVKVDA